MRIVIYASTFEDIRYFLTLFHTGVAKFAQFYVMKVFAKVQWCQVFTADFQCDYPIDVTAVEYVEPVKKQDVKFKQKIVTVGLSRKSFISLNP